MKNKPGVPSLRIPLPKQVEKKFKDKNKYERKEKHSKNKSLECFLLKTVIN